MRIAIVTTWPTDVISGSGTAVFFNALLGGLHAHGYDLDVIAPNFDTSDYVQVTLQRFLYNAELRTEPRVLSADLVIGFDYDGYALDPATRPPMLASAHAVYADVMPWESEPFRTMVQAQAFFDKVSMERADHITIGSEYAKDRVVALYGIPPEKITVIPHGLGITLPEWMKLVDAEPRRENDHPIILSVGKLFPRKRINILLRAIALLKADHPTVELRIVGNGLEWDSLHKLVDELTVSGNVTWLDHIDGDVPFAQEWRQADIFCHPSVQETFGYVYLEAMTIGKPIVAVRAGAAPEVLDDAALLTEPENPPALAAALDRFIRDEALRKAYGEKARRRATQFTHERMIKGYLEVIRRLAHTP